MSTVLEVGLLIVGYFLGIWWFSLVVLPLVYGLPRGLYWAARGKVRWRTPFLYLLGPLIWTVVLFGVVFILTIFLPKVATYLKQSGTFAVGLTLGILIHVGRSLFSQSTQLAMTRDFVDFIRPHLTNAGRENLSSAMGADSVK